MKSALWGILAVALLALAPSAVRAEQVAAMTLLDAKTEYSADYYLVTDGKGEYRGTVIHAPARERREFTTTQGRQILLLRRDIGEATMMWPERKWYLSVPLDTVSSLAGGIETMMLDRRRTGSETVSGERCTRYDVTSASGDDAFSGRMWFTGDGILMKASGTVRFRGRVTKVETGLSHLLRVRSDTQAFVPPADYKGLPLDPAKFGLGQR